MNTAPMPLIDMFQYDFIRRAFVVGVIVAVIAPLIGIFLVVRRQSLIADTMAHVSLAGAAIGFLSGLNPYGTALVAAVISAFGTERLRSARRLPADALLSLFLSGSLATATIILSISGGFNARLYSFLFGSVTTVSPSDVWRIAVLGIAVVATVILLYKELFLISFDEELALSSGVPAHTITIVLGLLTAITVSLSIGIVGVLLIGALMVIPVITAMQFKLGFRQTTYLSVLFSLLAVVTGLVLSYVFAIASGGTIVGLSIVLFILSVLINSRED